MGLSLLIAKITCVVYLAAALGGFLSRDHYRRVLDDAFSNAALTYFMGFVAVILGGLMVTYHNIWTWDWTVLVTILGWLALVKGVVLIAVPRFVHGCSRWMLGSKGMQVFPYVAAAVGLVFGYCGFVR